MDDKKIEADVRIFIFLSSIFRSNPSLPGILQNRDNCALPPD